METVHLDPFARARSNAETSTRNSTIRTSSDDAPVIAMAAPAGIDLAAFPPKERAMPDTHNIRYSDQAIISVGTIQCSATARAKPRHAGAHFPSFVWDLPVGVGQRRKRCWWYVQPTGDPLADGRLGEKYALEYLHYERVKNCSGTLLPTIVGDMPREQDVITIAFLQLVAFAASGNGLITAKTHIDFLQRRRLHGETI
jgi:hypothetical protein